MDAQGLFIIRKKLYSSKIMILILRQISYLSIFFAF